MFRIYFKQVNKKNGACIGQGQSVKTYDSIEEAEKDIAEFTFENDDFVQEVVAIKSKTVMVID